MTRPHALSALGLLLALLFATGCITAITPAVNSAALHEVDFSKDFKMGEDCALMVLLFGPFGDASVVSAAKDAGISKVHVVDFRVENYILASRRCTLVYGE